MQILGRPASGREAIAYGQQHFPAFSDVRMVDIQRLMGAVLYAGRLGGSPYADLASREQVTFPHGLIALGHSHLRRGEHAQVSRTEAQIVQDNCLLHRLPKDGALDVSLEAGFIALPNLLKLQAVMKATGSDLKAAESLPVCGRSPARRVAWWHRDRVVPGGD